MVTLQDCLLSTKCIVILCSEIFMIPLHLPLPVILSIIHLLKWQLYTLCTMPALSHAIAGLLFTIFLKYDFHCIWNWFIVKTCPVYKAHCRCLLCRYHFFSPIPKWIWVPCISASIKVCRDLLEMDRWYQQVVPRQMCCFLQELFIVLANGIYSITLTHTTWCMIESMSYVIYLRCSLGTTRIRSWYSIYLLAFMSTV
jgi:hypothetical protein